MTEVEEWAVPVRALGEVVVGSTYALLDGENPTCRAGECNLGSFIADALLSEHIEFQGDDGWSDVSISMINSGAIRASISPGEGYSQYIILIGRYNRKKWIGNTFINDPYG